MRARHARQIRRGIERSRQAQLLLDGINLNPTTLAAYALGMALIRLTNAETSTLEKRAYLRTRESVPKRGNRSTDAG